MMDALSAQARYVHLAAALIARRTSRRTLKTRDRFPRTTHVRERYTPDYLLSIPLLTYLSLLDSPAQTDGQHLSAVHTTHNPYRMHTYIRPGVQRYSSMHSTHSTTFPFYIHLYHIIHTSLITPYPPFISLPSPLSISSAHNNIYGTICAERRRVALSIVSGYFMIVSFRTWFIAEKGLVGGGGRKYKGGNVAQE
ncbi:uncharacterized protein EI97DRAFT_464688 [Westerdykella ornata]|uniref:Uncharacterized protein n=1 Tax=Westerdykella ornata TaxID=318751 RepID=A0A6A6JUJ2_WESOR|nr:uncharacterized protein EI97DRAFT_464688 [Westerdykella ornata]KAF2279416.1 hypothetical protein EI97DRAFT_464688 [Westerdykella ornata]